MDRLVLSGHDAADLLHIATKFGVSEDDARMILEMEKGAPGDVVIVDKDTGEESAPEWRSIFEDDEP